MNKRDKGFTFIELILYMAILGIFMVAVMSLVGTTVASNKKQKSREKLQTQATETYDFISNILMGAMDVAIQDGGTYGTATSPAKHCYVVPGNMTSSGGIEVDKTSGEIKTGGGTPLSMSTMTSVPSGTSKGSALCYDIEKASGYIDTQYLWFSYSPAINKTTFCTIKYDPSTKILSIARDGEIATSALDATSFSERKKFVDKGTDDKDGILAENVTAFKTKVNFDDNSIELIIDLEDDKTGQKYEVSGVVGLRNSFVLKKHGWN